MHGCLAASIMGALLTTSINHCMEASQNHHHMVTGFTITTVNAVVNTTVVKLHSGAMAVSNSPITY